MKKIILITLTLIFCSNNSSAQTQEKIKLSLNEARITALQNNRDIKIEKENIEISLGEIQFQKGVFDPILNLSGNYRNSENPTASTFIESGSTNEEEYFAQGNIEGKLPTGTFYNILDFSVSRLETDSPVETLSPNVFTSLGITIGQELLRDFGFDANLAQYRVAKRSNIIAQEELEQRVSEVLLDVEAFYWNLVAAEENLDLANTALDLANDLLRRNTIQVEVGVLPRVVISQAKSEVAAREVDLIRAENTLRAAKDNLLNILTLPLYFDIETTDEPQITIKNPDEEEALKQAIEKRPELQQAELDVNNKEDQKKFFSNQRLPQLAIQGTVNLQGLGGEENPNTLSFGGDATETEPISDLFDQQSDAFRNIYDANFPTWQVLATFSYPLFNWKARGDYTRASADLNKSIITYKKTKDDVALDIRNAIRELENKLREIEASNTAVSLAEEVLDNEEKRLEAGIGTTREVLEAQRDLINERTLQITAITDYNIALATLERAKGTIIEASNLEIEK